MHEEFIGTGWAFPMGVSAIGGIAMARREHELEQAMRLILSTYPGERPMRPEFGCRLRDFVFQGASDETAARLAYEVKNSLRRWEARVDIEKVDVTVDTYERNLLFIDIKYAVKATNDRRNLVFPFYTIPEEREEAQ
ncbi:MAG: GPW/gp25 family protein [Acidimicrobiales bacterium]